MAGLGPTAVTQVWNDFRLRRASTSESLVPLNNGVIRGVDPSDAADGALLGLLTADFLLRDGTPKPHCNTRPLDRKESRRWVDVTRHAADLLAAGANSVLVVADREADLYKTFAFNALIDKILMRLQLNGNQLLKFFFFSQIVYLLNVLQPK